MSASQHMFHIPVMGTGFTLDTPLRVARFGISSVMSLVDDMLLERVRHHYASVAGYPAEPIRADAPDARARRVTAYLDLVSDLLDDQMVVIRSLPFQRGNDKCRYFELLPGESALRQSY